MLSLPVLCQPPTILTFNAFHYFVTPRLQKHFLGLSECKEADSKSFESGY
jgi:hypothetical protein